MTRLSFWMCLLQRKIDSEIQLILIILILTDTMVYDVHIVTKLCKQFSNSRWIFLSVVLLWECQQNFCDLYRIHYGIALSLYQQTLQEYLKKLGQGQCTGKLLVVLLISLILCAIIIKLLFFYISWLCRDILGIELANLLFILWMNGQFHWNECLCWVYDFDTIFQGL